MPFTAGHRLGSYEILGPLGAGGMGEVYRARDTRLDRDVAVKVLPAALSADAGLKQRLERDLAPQPGVASAIDLAHAAGAQRTEDLVGTQAMAGGEGHGR